MGWATRERKVSIFDGLEMRLNNQLFYRLHLNAALYYKCGHSYTIIIFGILGPEGVWELDLVVRLERRLFSVFSGQRR